MHSHVGAVIHEEAAAVVTISCCRNEGDLMRSFDVLSDVEFEGVAADILAAELNRPVERFARGRDGGVDLRWKDGQMVVGIAQCKHYARSTFAHLLSAAQKEVDHARALASVDYRFVTSFDLSKTQKDQIYELFQKWMQGPESVIGGRDLDGLLTRHPQVERRHPKLWLSTGTQLYWALHSDIASRSTALRDRIQRSLARYVVNDGLQRAREVLDNRKVCIIAGVPGIGKTMLGQVLVADAVAAGYEPVEVSEDISEAWSALGDGLQIFFYDDFLGQLSFSERLGKNEDRRLTDFIEKISKTQSKLFVLTTREYVLRDAQRTYERLRRLDDRMHFVLALDDYTTIDRARILYNHLWHGSVSASALSEVADGGWRRIVHHTGYSPRLVEYCTGDSFDGGSAGYVDRVVNILNHPEELWATGFDQHLSRVQQLLVIVLAALPPQTPVSDALAAHHALCRKVGLDVDGSLFRTALGSSEGTFIELTNVGGVPMVSYHNPSVREFALDRLAGDPVLVAAIVQSAVFFDQLQRLFVHGQGSAMGWQNAKPRPDLLRVLDQLATEFSAAIERTFDLSRQDRVTGGLHASEHPEESLAFCVSLGPKFRPTLDWFAHQLELLVSSWAIDKGQKSEAIDLIRSLRSNPAVVSSQLLDDAQDALESWLRRTLDETEDDWVPLLDYVRNELGQDLASDQRLVEEFEEHSLAELDRWSPEPPMLSELRDFAESMQLGELTEILSRKMAESEARDEENVRQARERASSQSPADRSVHVTQHDFDGLFARLRSRPATS